MEEIILPIENAEKYLGFDIFSEENKVEIEIISQ